MKKIASTLLVAGALALLAQTAFAVSPNVRISQIYGGGGATTGAPTYNQDYVELFNNSGTAVDISGWTIEYASAAGAWGSLPANIYTFAPGTSIQPCAYLLVASAMLLNATGGPLPVVPDFTSTLPLAATGGNVGLFNTGAGNANVACGSEAAGSLVDKVGYGTGACGETTAMAALSTTLIGVRGSGGITDSDNNSLDFAAVAAAAPRNSASPLNTGCQVTPVTPRTWGQLKTMYR